MATVALFPIAILSFCSSLACTGQRAADSATPLTYAYEAVRFAPSPDRKDSVATVDSLSLVLSEPDNVERPSAWEGPLRVRHVDSGRSCEAESSLITQVYLDNRRSVALVVSYSGSVTFVDFVDVDTCGVKWPRIEGFTERVVVNGDRVSIHPGCEGTGARSKCTAGRVFRLDAVNPPVILDDESRTLTKSVIGVEFTGQRWVENPKTPNAKILQ